MFNSVTSAPFNLIVYTNAAATLDNVTATTSGQFQLTVSGVTKLRYLVQVSTNLVNWNNISVGYSPFAFTDLNVNVYPQRYFRAVYAPVYLP